MQFGMGSRLDSCKYWKCQYLHIAVSHPSAEISCVIIDDDEPSCRQLEGELKKRGAEFDLVGVHSCFKEGALKVQLHAPKVIFINIGFPFFSGKEMLGITSARPSKLIFLAKESNYVHQPIKTSRFDCLLKPFSVSDLRRTLNRLVETNRDPTTEPFRPYARSDEFVFNKLALPTSDGHLFVDPNAILYCQADEEYTRITMAGKSHLISKHLKYFEARLSQNRFFRIHKSYLINLEFVRSMVKTEGGHVLMANDKLIPIGRSRRKEFTLLMGV